ncbi:hypothetical protein LCGC14_1299400 [marine sediment metagenome]|uniref:Uncharacterized protein n=1 Tax=marine sediment metagenome TaxID=412755 RepID=A0A0F9KQG2_9ZZZZ
MEDNESLRMEIEKLKKQLEIKDSLIKLKDEQVKTLENSLKLKDEVIRTLESSLNIKDEKAKTLEKQIKLKEEEIENLISTSLDPLLLKEKVEKIKDLEKELKILNGELAKSDEDLESLELELEKLTNEKANPATSNILEATNTNISKSEIIEKMKDILQNASHKVMIVTPNILDLQDVPVYDVRSSVSVNIACLVNEGIDEHTELLDELLSLDNIAIRKYEREDRYVITRDGEELFLAVIGNSENNYLVIHTQDRNHIRLLNSLTMEAWIASRKI